MKGNAVKRGQAANGNRATKAKMRLAERVKEYEETVSRRTDNGRGYRKPGSLQLPR